MSTTHTADVDADLDADGQAPEQVGSARPAAAHMDSMTTRKPTLPPQSHIDISLAVTTALAGASDADIDSLPAKVRESLDYFTEVAEVATAIQTEQAEALKEYRDETAEFLAAHLGALDGVDLTVEAARDLVDNVFSSHLMARLLADVAAGNIEPVATVAKTAKATAAPKAAKKPAADAAAAAADVAATAGDTANGETADPTGDSPADAQGEPTPTKRTRKRRSSAQQAEAPAAETPGVVAPAASIDDLNDPEVPDTLAPGSPDVEPILPPDPEEVAAAYANAAAADAAAAERALPPDPDEFTEPVAEPVVEKPRPVPTPPPGYSPIGDGDDDF